MATCTCTYVCIHVCMLTGQVIPFAGFPDPSLHRCELTLYADFQWRRHCSYYSFNMHYLPSTSSSFLDKMYSLSSNEALVQFTRNPRAYLLPPQPCIPCKVCVVGPSTSGKTSLARAVAQKYNATVSAPSRWR